jgi:purine-nucleoside/S-methyl-5'-thioadenosine phosphorylase / adenosine deaminase
VRIEHSPIGRIVVPDQVPSGRALFYTTLDFPGRIDDRIRGFVRERFDATLSTCNQVHGATVRRVLTPTPQDTCDALWTSQRHVALGIKVADCLPVTVIGNDVIANIHSGWRGAVHRITAVTLDAIERDTNFDPHNAFAYLGPSIRVCCFEVGEEVATQFASSVVDRTQEKPHVDIALLTVDLLRSRGFQESRIFDSGLCTRCDKSIFHSFRRDGKGGGRNLAIVAQ